MQVITKFSTINFSKSFLVRHSLLFVLDSHHCHCHLCRIRLLCDDHEGHYCHHHLCCIRLLYDNQNVHDGHDESIDCHTRCYSKDCKDSLPHAHNHDVQDMYILSNMDCDHRHVNQPVLMTISPTVEIHAALSILLEAVQHCHRFTCCGLFLLTRLGCSTFDLISSFRERK
jgi:hypothetical protein